MTPPGLILSIDFAEHEARFLAGVVEAVDIGRLTADQRRAVGSISTKFAEAGNAALAVLRRLYGPDALSIAEEVMALHPDIEELR